MISLFEVASWTAKLLPALVRLGIRDSRAKAGPQLARSIGSMHKLSWKFQNPFRDQFSRLCGEASSKRSHSICKAFSRTGAHSLTDLPECVH